MDVTRGGVLECWNERNPDAQLRKGDLIVEINGKRGSAQRMLRSVATSITCKIVARSSKSNVDMHSIVQLQYRELSSSDLLLFVDVFANIHQDAKLDRPRVALNRVKVSECNEYWEQCCPICLDDFNPEHVVAKLPCKHAFCVHCIEDWMDRSRACPMCQVLVDEECNRLACKTEVSEEFDLIGIDEVGLEFTAHEPPVMECPALLQKGITATRGREMQLEAVPRWL
jgi:hypothetical protein